MQAAGLQVLEGTRSMRSNPIYAAQILVGTVRGLRIFVYLMLCILADHFASYLAISSSKVSTMCISIRCPAIQVLSMPLLSQLGMRMHCFEADSTTTCVKCTQFTDQLCDMLQMSYHSPTQRPGTLFTVVGPLEPSFQSWAKTPASIEVSRLAAKA